MFDVSPQFASGREGGPWSVLEAIGYLPGWNAVGFLVNGMVRGEVEGVLLVFGAEVSKGSPEALVWMPRLKGRAFKWMHTGFDV